MKSVFKRKEECSGCTACEKICPKKAIKMQEDEEGFLYPVIDTTKCIQCGLCEKICAFQKTKKNEIKEAYAVKHKQVEERKTSRSGGAFVALADEILKQDGVIYGAKFTENHMVEHARATNKQQRDELKGSKYIQSKMKDIFNQVKTDLQQGKKVLYTGTPCQVGGLNNYLEKQDCSNLYTCDLICHAIPSPKVYQKYLEFQEKKIGKKIKKVDFRDKKYGWNSHKETLIFEDGSSISTEWLKELFYQNLDIRPSCYSCTFKKKQRVSDITLADFWGIEKVVPNFYDEIGVSLVLINTQKGKELFQKVKKDLEVISCDIENAIKGNATMYQGMVVPKKRKQFWIDLENEDFETVMEKYATKK